jgi:thymidylate kinase
MLEWNSNRIVVCDRYSLSTFVYQVLNQPKEVRELWDFLSVRVVQPDITFVLDIDPETAAKRIKSRGDINHFDLVNLKERADAFLIYGSLYDNHHVIDANGSVEATLTNVVEVWNQHDYLLTG